MRISAPLYTQTPNDLFDHWLPNLKEVELKVLLVILRKTFGWHKTHDEISISQIQKMTGSTATNVLCAIKSLISYGLIKKEVSGKTGQQRTIYSLVIHEDSNNYNPCQPSRPTPAKSAAGTPAKLAGTKESSFKETPKEQQHDAAVSPKIYNCLECIDIPNRDKIQITERNLEVNVKKAIEWATHPEVKINKTLVQAIKWACANKPEMPKNKSAEVELNKAYAKQQEAQYPNGITISCLNKCIEIACTQSQRQPIVIQYTEQGFKEQLDSALRKSNITPR